MSAGKGTAHECVLDRDCTICRGISPSEPHRLASPAQCLAANDTPRFAGRQSPQQWQHTGADASLLLCGMYTCREPMLLCKAILPWLHQTSHMSYRLCAAQACCAPSPLATMPSSSSAWQADSSLQLACTFAGSATPGPRRQRYAWTNSWVQGGPKSTSPDVTPRSVPSSAAPPAATLPGRCPPPGLQADAAR